MREPFAARLPLSRTAVDRDHLGRTDGVERFLDDAATRAVVLHGGRALLTPAGDRLALLPVDAVPSPLFAVYLGRSLTGADDLGEGSPVVLLAVDDDGADVLAPDRARWGDLRRIADRLADRDAGLFTQALAIANWHTAYAFAPESGSPTEVHSSGWARRDPVSGRDVFPRTDPAVIMAVIDDDDRILLGANASWDANRFSLLAGFVEPGESLEAAVIREVHEESGIRVVDPEYLGSQPWPFPASIMLGFRARVAPGASTEPRPDGEEILELRWFSREELRAGLSDIGLPGRVSIARAIIEDWYGGAIDDEHEPLA